MARALKNVMIKRLALTARGANRNRKAIFKSDRLGEIFGDLSDAEKKELHKSGNNSEELAAFISEKMEEQEVSASQLAKAADISEETVNQIIEGDITRPPDRRLKDIAKKLGVEFKDLLNLIPAELRKQFCCDEYVMKKQDMEDYEIEGSGDLAKADMLLEVAGVAEQLRKGDMTTEDAADFLEETVVKYEKLIPVEKGEAGEDNEPNTSLDDLRELTGI